MQSAFAAKIGGGEGTHLKMRYKYVCASFKTPFFTPISRLLFSSIRPPFEDVSVLQDLSISQIVTEIFSS